MSTEESDLATALLLERQILQEKRPLACGCVIESKYGHPARRGWCLVSGYIDACPPHNKFYVSFAKEQKQAWGGPFVPKWRDEFGLWITKQEWDENTVCNEHGVFEYKGFRYLLLVGYLGTPVTLGKEKGEKMAGRVISLDLATGKTFPAPVPEELLQRFGWVKTEG